MGILGNLVNKVYQKVLDPFTTVVSHPIQSISAIINPNKNFSEVVNKTVNEPKSQQIIEAITTGVTLGSIGGIVKTGVTKGTGALLSTIIPKTTQGKVIAGLAAPAVASAVITNPKILGKVTELPSKSAAFGADVGTAIGNPTKENILNIVTENPLISTIAAGGLIAGGAGALVTGIGALENIKTRESVQDLTSTLNNQLPKEASNPTTVKTETQPYAPTTAITPATQPLKSSTAARRKKKRSKTSSSPTAINQKVNVIVSNKSVSSGIKQSKNYLKREVLAY